jgi:hypothetical protein
VRRSFIPITVALVLALGLGLLVGGTAPSTAVAVNGETVPTSQVNADLAAAAGNPHYLCYMNLAALIRSGGSSGLSSVHGATTASYSSSFVSNWLDQDITSLIIKQGAQAEGIGSLTQGQLIAAQTDLLGSMDATLGQGSCGQSATQILGSMPPSFVRRQIESQAYAEALLVKHGGESLDPASLEAYYARHQSSFDGYCVVLVQSTDPSIKQQIDAGIAAGKTFQQMATSLSNGSTTATQSGCVTPASAIYSRLASYASKLTVGGSGGPYILGNTVLVMLVTSRTTTPYASISNVVRRTVLAEDGSRASAKSLALVNAAEVSVDPRYGTWSRHKASSTVVPPPLPAAKTLVNKTALG